MQCFHTSCLCATFCLLQLKDHKVAIARVHVLLGEPQPLERLEEGTKALTLPAFPCKAAAYLQSHNEVSTDKCTCIMNRCCCMMFIYEAALPPHLWRSFCLSGQYFLLLYINGACKNLSQNSCCGHWSQCVFQVSKSLSKPMVRAVLVSKTVTAVPEGAPQQSRAALGASGRGEPPSGKKGSQSPSAPGRIQQCPQTMCLPDHKI